MRSSVIVSPRSAADHVAGDLVQLPSAYAKRAAGLAGERRPASSRARARCRSPARGDGVDARGGDDREARRRRGAELHRRWRRRGRCRAIETVAPPLVVPRARQQLASRAARAGSPAATLTTKPSGCRRLPAVVRLQSAGGRQLAVGEARRRAGEVGAAVAVDRDRRAAVAHAAADDRRVHERRCRRVDSLLRNASRVAGSWTAIGVARAGSRRRPSSRRRRRCAPSTAIALPLSDDPPPRYVEYSSVVALALSFVTNASPSPASAGLQRRRPSSGTIAEFVWPVTYACPPDTAMAARSRRRSAPVRRRRRRRRRGTSSTPSADAVGVELRDEAVGLRAAGQRGLRDAAVAGKFSDAVCPATYALPRVDVDAERARRRAGAAEIRRVHERRCRRR